MTVFSSSKDMPCFAVLLSGKLLLDDMTYRVMVEKLFSLAKEQPGYLHGEWVMAESSIIMTYWENRESAEAWLNHDMQRRVLSIGEHFWYAEYSLQLMEVVRNMTFKQEQKDLHASRFPYIKTQRGVLKVLDESQAPLLYQYINEEKNFLMPWEPARHDIYYSMETCQLRIREMRRDFLEDKGVVLCLLSKEEDRMLAYTNYSSIIRGVFQACHLGYSLRESEQGKGLMHEALESGIQYIHKELNIDRIQANYMPRNVKSAAVLKKLGFEKEGVARDYLKINGQWEDHILTALVLRSSSSSI